MPAIKSFGKDNITHAKLKYSQFRNNAFIKPFCNILSQLAATFMLHYIRTQKSKCKINIKNGALHIYYINRNRNSLGLSLQNYSPSKHINITLKK